MTASPVFHEVFSSQKTIEGIPINLRISEISKETMTQICRFAYTENLTLTQNNMFPIIKAASKLQMKFLVEKVTSFICEKGMNDQTVFQILEVNENIKSMAIPMKCFEFIKENYQKCFKNKDFLNCSHDTLRLMLQTCKIPQVAAKEALALWSAQDKNSGEDLDEIIALISLNDYPEEKPNVGNNNNNGSDSESINSKNSRTPSGGQGRTRNRGGQNQQFNSQMRGSNPNLAQQQFQQRNNRNRNQGNGANQNQQSGGLYNNGPNNNNSQQQQQFGSLKHFALHGHQVRKNSKFANLNLMSTQSSVTISEIRFLYDLSTTDKEFDIFISDVTEPRKIDLFYDKVSINKDFRSYTLPRACIIPSNRKIWITIEFTNSEYRPAMENYSVLPSSCKDLALRMEANSNLHGQIISAFILK